MTEPSVTIKPKGHGVITPAMMLKIGMVVAALGWLYAPVLSGLAWDWWHDPNNSHGLLVPWVSLYLLWERWQPLGRLPLKPSWLGAGLMALGVLCLTAGSVGAELFVQRGSLIMMIIGLIWFNLGWQQVRLLLFPVLFLALAIPLPDLVLNQISFPLQLFAARCAEQVLYLLSIPVFREGNVIHLAQTTLEVAEACSGIRSLVSLISLALMFAYFAHRGTIERTVLALSAIPIAVIANAGRVAGTGILAQIFGVGAAQGFYHTFSGWLVFVAAVVILSAESALVRMIMTRRRASS